LPQVEHFFDLVVAALAAGLSADLAATPNFGLPNPTIEIRTPALFFL
jgi:hypothetical protein